MILFMDVANRLISITMITAQGVLVESRFDFLSVWQAQRQQYIY